MERSKKKKAQDFSRVPISPPIDVLGEMPSWSGKDLSS